MKTKNAPKPSNITRRDFLKLSGLSALVIVGGGGVWRAIDQGVFSTGEGPAYEAWKTWRSDEVEGPLALVRAAILAANPHNTQPWLFRVSDTSIEVFADTSRHLGAMDVYMREMHIGLGCAIENMLLAAKANGYQAQLTYSAGDLMNLSPTSEPVLAATLDLSAGEKSVSDLYESIPNRHTDRAAYDETLLVSAATLEALSTIADDYADIKLFLFTEDAQRKEFAAGSVQATEEIIADMVMAHDSAKWFRDNWKDVQENKDGPFIDTAGVSPIMRAFVKMLPPVSEATENASWLKSTEETLASTPLMGFIAVRKLYDKTQSMQAGQVWQRMHLWASTQGLSMQPVNQLLEIVDREHELGKAERTAQFLTALTGDADWKPTFAFRAGYPTMQVLASPRRPVEDVVFE